MYFYRLYGLDIQSDLELPQLVAISQKDMRAEQTILIEQKAFPERLRIDADSYYGFNQQIGYISNLCCYLYIEGGARISYEVKNKNYTNYLGSYILGWAMAMLLHQRGLLAIHCSCLKNEQGALLISGNSGAGKSTITTRLLDKGFQLMADDVAAVSVGDPKLSMAYPAFPYQKLCRDVAEKQSIPLEDMLYIDEMKDKYLKPYEGNFSCDPAPIKALVLIKKMPKEEFRCKELTGVDRWNACVDALFLAPILGQRLREPLFSLPALAMAGAVPVLYIERGSVLDYRDRVEHAIIDFLEKHNCS